MYITRTVTKEIMVLLCNLLTQFVEDSCHCPRTPFTRHIHEKLVFLWWEDKKFIANYFS